VGLYQQEISFLEQLLTTHIEKTQINFDIPNKNKRPVVLLQAEYILHFKHNEELVETTSIRPIPSDTKKVETQKENLVNGVYLNEPKTPVKSKLASKKSSKKNNLTNALWIPPILADVTEIFSPQLADEHSIAPSLSGLSISTPARTIVEDKKVKKNSFTKPVLGRKHVSVKLPNNGKTSPLKRMSPEPEGKEDQDNFTKTKVFKRNNKNVLKSRPPLFQLKSNKHTTNSSIANFR
jgi:hypothetical protein